MSYGYYKALPLAESEKTKKRRELILRTLRILPNVLIVLGATAVTTVSYPMLSYQLTVDRWQQRQVASPISKQDFDIARGIVKREVPVLGSDPATPIQAVNESLPPSPPIVIDDIDYSKASNWFPAINTQTVSGIPIEQPTTYTLSIPKLDIEGMNVKIGGENLDNSLIHYAGTAIPGQYGNPVIFGHSVLPLFYNPKSYISVFSKLPTLEEGDEIFVNYDKVEYKYLVDSYHEVQPDQVDVLEQRYDRKTVTLITCVPPGTYLRRGVIQAHLVEY